MDGVIMFRDQATPHIRVRWEKVAYDAKVDYKPSPRRKTLIAPVQLALLIYGAAMRAVLCQQWGGPEKLVVADVPPPPLGEGSVRIRVRAAGVNFADLLLIAGQYQEKPAFPFTPGAEAAGVITEVAAGVSGLKSSERVMALTGLGAFAEEAVVDAARVLPIPDSMSFPIAAGFPVAYGTSHGALEWPQARNGGSGKSARGALSIAWRGRA